MKNIITTIAIIVLAILALFTSVIGVTLITLGVAGLNDTHNVSSVLSLCAGLMLISLVLWFLPWNWIATMWNNHTDRMTKEGKDLPLVQNGYEIHNKECDMKKYTEQDLFDAKELVATVWADECSSLATSLKHTQEMLAKSIETGNIWKSMYERMEKEVKTLRAEKTEKQNEECVKILAENESIRKAIISDMEEKAKMVKHQTYFLSGQDYIVANNQLAEARNLLKDASIKTAGNCPEQRASFNSIIELALSTINGVKAMIKAKRGL